MGEAYENEDAKMEGSEVSGLEGGRESERGKGREREEREEREGEREETATVQSPLLRFSSAMFLLVALLSADICFSPPWLPLPAMAWACIPNSSMVFAFFARRPNFLAGFSLRSCPTLAPASEGRPHGS